MMFVIDTNILISALIRDSTTRKIIVESDWDFCYPENAFHEVRRYKDLVLEKSGIDEKEYNQVLNYLFQHINLIPEEVVQQKHDEAFRLLGEIDPDDVIFLATALSLKNAKIWSDDGHLEKQDKISVFKTKHLVRLF
ncbi:MAG: PIN domain-containing protein [Nanoarchaeota archaeon]